MTASLTAHAVRTIGDDACWELLRSESLGRLAVVAEDGVDIFPVNYLVNRGTILFRSAPGTKLADIVHNPIVAFEVDGIDDRHRWSVVVRGVARRLDADDEIESSGVLGLETLTVTTKFNYVQITPRVITGRLLGREGIE
ncbi:pyridoxamine 5'-phosphate oxidase family protein [Pseudolysinimonas sp.]|uniref:pyridoxamine 5'-phosphate oxidase family protein n=1 Tax=Pseudolysinimonas sp. TaxID=2680009 RepID=UPI00286B588B|nr:pyridoxamine 5'-phosphate oxidase family protein [Pseudolysinimonas sp.]